MTNGTARKPSQRHNRTIILPIEQEKYRQIISAPQHFRDWIDKNYHLHWGRKARQANEGYRCPAERLNGKRYADCWLENLLVATSAVPQKKAAT